MPRHVPGLLDDWDHVSEAGRAARRNARREDIQGLTGIAVTVFLMIAAACI